MVINKCPVTTKQDLPFLNKVLNKKWYDYLVTGQRLTYVFEIKKRPVATKQNILILTTEKMSYLLI